MTAVYPAASDLAAVVRPASRVKIVSNKLIVR